ncbi:MAG: right-handed parallel beta-helix repeat-containing protein [Candidatus Nitrosopolaris sp.]
MIIRNDIVYDNNGSGIICSLNCYNILIENNKVHDNAGDGIVFSRNMYNSIVRNNIVHNEPTGISVSQSHNNQISNNTILKSGNGIQVGSGSSKKQNIWKYNSQLRLTGYTHQQWIIRKHLFCE